MSLTSGDITTLLATRKPKVCAYWAVYWDFGNDAETVYYSDAPYQREPGFMNIGLTLVPQILGGSIAQNVQFEINPDIKAEKVSIRFNDIPARNDLTRTRPISPKFNEWKSGVRCELFFYYADVNKHESKWTGQLKLPKDGYKRGEINAVATNGFRSREQKMPKRTRPRECTATFGGCLSTQEAIDSNGCAYNKHLGGSIGTYRTGTTPYLSCPRNSTSACNARMGTSNGENYLGFDTDASATVTSGNPNVGPAVSRGNQSSLTKPIRKIYGQKYVREMPLLLWRREIGAPDPNHDWVSGISEIGEGPIQDAYDFKVLGGKPPQAIATQVRYGARAQAAISNYAAVMSNFSYTALVRWKYGWINAGQANASDMTCEGRVIGYAAVPVYTNSSTFSRVWSDNNLWCIFDAMTDHRSGLGYAHSRFNIDNCLEIADWTTNTISLAELDEAGTTGTYAGRRATCDVTMEGRPSHEQIEDMCLSSGFSMPFLHDGKFNFAAFRKATSGELAAARTFTDKGTTPNIIWEKDRPLITFGQVPDDEVVNQIDLTFEEADNYDVARPLTRDDPNQQLLAGRAYLGEDNLHPVPKSYSAITIRQTHEAVRHARRLLWFGPFDKGGTMNNITAKFTTPYLQLLGLKRFDVINIDSDLDDDMPLGKMFGTTDLSDTPGRYRILNAKKIGNGRAEVEVIAYNHVAYTYFDNVTSVDPPVFNVCSIDADCPDGYVCVNGRCVHEPPPPPCVLAVTSITYDDSNQLLEIIAPPC